MRARLLAFSALLLVLPVGAMAETIRVHQMGTSFNPNDITIQLGDTVEWMWHNQSHTVTSGINASDPNAGDLFDAPLDAGHPFYSFTFTDVGDQPYFCRPHVGMGMTGIVRVEGPTAVPEGEPLELVTFSTVKSLY